MSDTIQQNLKNLTEHDQDNVFAAVHNVYSQLEAIEKFVARRFDELSMEINATSQQVDMAEDGITKRFSEILEILSAISYTGAGDSAANSGVELQAVIHDTENAANKILDAAERIAETVGDDLDWSDDTVRADLRDKIANDVQEILLACTFQDLTGQRIRNTLDNLHQIESRLSSTFERLGIDITPSADAIQKQVVKASSQEEIDALIKGYDAAQSANAEEKPVDQDDIDKLFNE